MRPGPIRDAMTVYYQDEKVTLHLGDCRTVPEWMRADVLVTDPPYGVAFRSNHRGPRKTDIGDAIAGDESTSLRDATLEVWGDRPALVFGTWRAPRPRNVRQRLIWAKGDDPGIGDLSLPWGYGDEEIYVIGSGWIGARRTNVYRLPKVAAINNPGHPTPKPVALMEALISHIPAHLTIADPFAGSGATVIAARNLGRRIVAVEIERRYCDIIVRRLSQQAFDFEALTNPTRPDEPYRLEPLIDIDADDDADPEGAHYVST